MNLLEASRNLANANRLLETGKQLQWPAETMARAELLKAAAQQAMDSAWKNAWLPEQTFAGVQSHWSAARLCHCGGAEGHTLRCTQCGRIGCDACQPGGIAAPCRWCAGRVVENSL